MNAKRKGESDSSAETSHDFKSFSDWERKYFPKGVERGMGVDTSDPEQYAANLAEESLRRINRDVE